MKDISFAQIYSRTELPDDFQILADPYSTPDEVSRMLELGALFYRDAEHAGSAFSAPFEQPIDAFYYQFTFNTKTGEVVKWVVGGPGRTKRVRILWMDSMFVRRNFLS